MAEAQANSTQEECDLEVEEDLFHLKFNLPMSDSELQDYSQYSQEYDDSGFSMQNADGNLENTQDAGDDLENTENAGDDSENNENVVEDLEIWKNAGKDVDETQCPEGDEILKSQRDQRSEKRRKTAQLSKNKVKDAYATLTEKQKRKAENDPVKRPQAKSKRKDANAVWYFYEPFT